MMQFASQDDQNLYMNLKGLCNKTDGVFKSAKQAQFLFSTYSKQFDTNWTRKQFLTNFGVKVGDKEIAVVVNAYFSWADYGSKSLVPVLQVFVLDQAGVVSHYKVGGRGNLRDGWGPDPSKAELKWLRPDALTVPDFTAQPSQQQDTIVKQSNWIGAVGQKVNIECKIVRAKDLGFGNFGPMFLTVLEDNNGNVVNVWRNIGPVGQTVKLAGTVKDCGQYKETKQTTLTRVQIVQ